MGSNRIRSERRTMTIDQLKEVLLTLKRTCQIVSFVAKTELKKWKPLKSCPDNENPYFPLIKGKGRKTRVHKISHLNGMIGAKYGSCVERAAERKAIRHGDDSFTMPEIAPRKWGGRIEGTPLVRHETKSGEVHHYLEYLHVRTLEQQFILDGELATPEETEDIKKYIPEHEAPSKGVEWRNFRLDHLESIKLSGEPIEVRS